MKKFVSTIFRSLEKGLQFSEKMVVKGIEKAEPVAKDLSARTNNAIKAFRTKPVDTKIQDLEKRIQELEDSYQERKNTPEAEDILREITEKQTEYMSLTGHEYEVK